jgi:hypothetical protein
MANASEVTHLRREGNFADEWTLRASRLRAQLVVAAVQLELSRMRPSATVLLPRVALHVERLQGPVGWSAALAGDVLVAGEPIAIPVRALPLVELRLVRGDEGELDPPKSVRLKIATEAREGNAESSAELPLELEVDGEVLRIGMDHRATDETGVRYALVFEWDDGGRTETGLGSWEHVSQLAELGPERQPKLR